MNYIFIFLLFANLVKTKLYVFLYTITKYFVYVSSLTVFIIYN